MNYVAVYGNTAGKNVDAASDLAAEFQHVLVNNSINFQQEALMPDCLSGFRGSKQRNAVQNETVRFALRFGEKSQFVDKTLEIFKEFSAKTKGKTMDAKTHRTYF